MFFDWKITVFRLKNIVYREKLCLSSEKYIFRYIIHLALINSVYRKKTMFFNQKNKVHRSIYSVYQIQKQSFSINCVFRSKNTVYRSINSVYLIERQNFLIDSVFRSKNIVFLKTMFFVDELCLSTWKTMFFDLKKLCFSETFIFLSINWVFCNKLFFKWKTVFFDRKTLFIADKQCFSMWQARCVINRKT